MPTLTAKFEDESLIEHRENWVLDNDLRAYASFWDKRCDVSFCSQTGDVTDQLYKIFQERGKFVDSKLYSIWGYMIKIAPNEFMALLEEAEKIDSSLLKEGKKY